MRSRVLLTLVAGVFAVLLAPSITEAQTKFSGKQQCAKPNPEYSVPVTDQANHVMMLAGQKCTWTQGEIGGDKFKDEDDVIAMDVVGNQSRDRGYGAGTMASGDKYNIRFDGTTTLKDKAPVAAQCTWAFTGGTGKLKGITGKGTCKGTFKPDGTAMFDIEGDYKIPAAGKK